MAKNDIHMILPDGMKDRLQAMAVQERRSLANMASVLLEWAINERMAPQTAAEFDSERSPSD